MSLEKIDNNYNQVNILKSKIILSKLINYYTYEHIIEYVFNPNEYDNQKLGKIIRRIINKIGVEDFAILLCSKDLLSFNRKKNFIKNRKQLNNKGMKEIIEIDENISNIEENQIFRKRENNENIINIYKNNSCYASKIIQNKEDDFIKTNQNEQMNEDEKYVDEINDSKNDISFHYSEDKNLDKNTVNNSIEEEDDDEKNENNKNNSQKEEQTIILNETNSYVYCILYKDKNQMNENLYYYCFESYNEDNKINMKCFDKKCESKGIYNLLTKQIIIMNNHSIPYEEHNYLKINYEEDELNLNIIDFIKDSPSIKGIEILKNKKMIEGGINEKNREAETNEESKESKEIRDNNEKEIIQNRIENNIKQLINFKNEPTKSEKEKENFISFNLNNIILKKNIKNEKLKVNGKEQNIINENGFSNSIIKFEGKNILDSKNSSYNFVEFKIKDLKNLEKNSNNHKLNKSNSKNHKNDINNSIEVEYPSLQSSKSNSYILLTENNDESILSVISNLDKDIKEKVIDDKVDENDYDFFFNLYGKTGMNKIDNLFLSTNDLEKKNNYKNIKNRHEKKELIKFLKKKQYEKLIKKENKEKVDVKQKRKIFGVINKSSFPSPIINLVEEDFENNIIIKKEKEKCDINKKPALFAIVNPNKKSPKFIIKNNNNLDINYKSRSINQLEYQKENNNNFSNSFNENNNNAESNKFYKNNINNSIIKEYKKKKKGQNYNSISEKNHNKINNENININEKEINNTNSKYKTKIKENKKYKKNLKNNNIIFNSKNNNCNNSIKDKEKKEENIDDKNKNIKISNNINYKYKVLIKKTFKNEKNDYLVGNDSKQNKNEVIFEINNDILYINQYIIYKGKKIGFHFHKKKEGKIFNYFPSTFQTLPDIIEFKCYLNECNGKAYYYCKDRKFEEIEKHSESMEFHYFTNYNNLIFKKIIEFMNNCDDIKDLQFLKD